MKLGAVITRNSASQALAKPSYLENKDAFDLENFAFVACAIGVGLLLVLCNPGLTEEPQQAQPWHQGTSAEAVSALGAHFRRREESL